MRKYYIDNIRWATVVLVVIFHVIYMFNGVCTAGVIGPITTVRGQDAIQYLLYPWFMAILFILSGMCSRFYLEKHSESEYIKARTGKLLVPSTIGLFVFQWIQGYFNMAISQAFSNFPDNFPGPMMYLIMVLSGTGVLWTIQVMWIFSVLLIAVRKLEKGLLVKIGEKATLPALILFGILFWGAAQILNTPVIPVYRFGIYGLSFFLGYFVFSNDSVIERLKQYCLPVLLAAGVLGIAYTWVYFGENYAEEPGINCPLAMSYAWMMCLGILGGAARWADVSNGFTRFMAKKSFGLYVFHYLALSATAYTLVTYTSFPSGVIYGLTALAAFVGAWILYEVIARIPILRWCILGIKKEKHV